MRLSHWAARDLLQIFYRYCADRKVTDRLNSCGSTGQRVRWDRYCSCVALVLRFPEPLDTRHRRSLDTLTGDARPWATHPNGGPYSRLRTFAIPPVTVSNWADPRRLLSGAAMRRKSTLCKGSERKLTGSEPRGHASLLGQVHLRRNAL